MGGKHFKRKTGEQKQREVPFKKDGQQYARVTKMLGNSRLEAVCGDGVTRLCRIRGQMRKRVWVSAGDTVLVGLRSFQDDKADVIDLYSYTESKLLKKYGELSRLDACCNDAEGSVSDDIVFGLADDSDVDAI